MTIERTDDKLTGKLVTLSIESESIACIQMRDETGKNALSEAFIEQLEKNLKQATEDLNIKVVLLIGLPTVFCSGADLKTLAALGKGDIQPVDIHLSKRLLDIPVPVIAAMEGHAVGGGLALGLCADIAILASESRYGCSFMNMGFTPGMGITKLMEHYMSPAVAHELLYTGVNKKGADLRDKTNINYILPKAEVLPMALQIAHAIAEKSRDSLVLLKRYLSIPRRKLFEETYSIESMMHDITFNQSSILKSIKENYVRG